MKLTQQPSELFYSTAFFLTSIISVTSWNYQIKLVRNIIPTEDYGIHVAVKVSTAAYSSINTDTFEEDDRLQMCKDASKIDDLKNRKIKFPKSAGRTGSKTLYTLQVSEEDPDIVELASAFSCPSQPPMYLLLHYVDEKVYVIMKSSELPAVCVVPDDYALKVVEKITDVDQLPSLSFAQAETPPLDFNECAEEVLSAMCEKASTSVDIVQGREIKILENGTPRPAIFYELTLTSHSELALAFQCQTEPAIYLQVHKNSANTQTVMTVVDRSDFFAIVDARTLSPP